MKAVLLAAGLGTRLAPLTKSTPKVLAQAHGRPLLDRQLRYLAGNGVAEVIVNAHHHANQIATFLQNFNPPPRTRLSYEPTLLGTAGALRPLRALLNEPFLVLYGDVATDANAAALMRAHYASGADATLAFYRSHETTGKGVLHIDTSGKVANFLEKPQGRHTDACINAGLYALSPSIFDAIEGDTPDFGADVWPSAIDQGLHIRGWELHGYIRDVGSPSALAELEADIGTGVVEW